MNARGRQSIPEIPHEAAPATQALRQGSGEIGTNRNGENLYPGGRSTARTVSSDNP